MNDQYLSASKDESRPPAEATPIVGSEFLPRIQYMTTDTLSAAH